MAGYRQRPIEGRYQAMGSITASSAPAKPHAGRTSSFLTTTKESFRLVPGAFARMPGAVDQAKGKKSRFYAYAWR